MQELSAKSMIAAARSERSPSSRGVIVGARLQPDCQGYMNQEIGELDSGLGQDQ